MAAAALLIYANSVTNPFVFDDLYTVVGNEQIRQVLSPSVLMPERELPVAGRPLVNLSFAINFALGGLNPLGYHLGNIAVHLACGLLLFGVVRRTLRLPRVGGWWAEHADSLAFAIALIWLVHPLNSEVVDYVTQRTESLMAAFYLLTIYAGLRAATGVHSTAWNVMAVLACAAGMASKESMVTAPVAVVLFERIFLFTGWNDMRRARGRQYLALAGTWVVLAALLATNPRGQSAGFSAGIGVATYLLNQPYFISRYLRLAVWPSSLVMNYGWAAPIALAQAFPYILLVGSLLAVTLWGLRHRPMLGFLGVWFFLTLAPSSSVVPIATEVAAERRMYLPLIAVIVLAIVGVTMAWRRLTSLRMLTLGSVAHRWTPVIATATAVLVLASTTWARNREYASGLRLAEVTVARFPSPNAHHMVAEQLLMEGRRDEAIGHLRQALPGAPRAHYTLGVELFKEGRLDEAIAELRAFIQEQPRFVTVIDAHGYIGTAFERQGKWEAAAREFREILKITPDNPAAEHSLADSLFMLREYDECIDHYRTYLQEQPNDTVALNQLGIALGAVGRLNEAITTFRRAAVIDPRDGPLRKNLALALLTRRDYAGAMVEARQAVALQPDDRESRELVSQLESAQPGAVRR